MNAKTSRWDVVIVGGGCAGLSAALILARARRRIIVLDGGQPRNRVAPQMHGVLGRDGVSPLEFLSEGRREVIVADGAIEFDQVLSITRGIDNVFEVLSRKDNLYRASRVVIATGVRDHLPDIPGLAEQWGRGAVTCPYCDGYEARNSTIGVLSVSRSGVHKAQMLREYSSDVTLLTSLIGVLPPGDLSALAARGIRVDDRKIVAVTNHSDILSGVEFSDGSQLALDVLFLDPAAVPQDDCLRQLAVVRAESEAGSWPATDATFETSVPGIFVIGNLANPAALVPVAMASGVIAATAINSQLIAENVAASLSVADTRPPR